MRCPKPSHKRKPGINPIPHELVEAVWQRDSGLCQSCGVYCGEPGILLPHHCVYGGTGRKRIHRIENLITLCLYCHNKVHSTKEMRFWTYEWSRKKYGNVIDKLLEVKWSGEK